MELISREAKMVEKTIRSIGVNNFTKKIVLTPLRLSKFLEPPKSIYKKHQVRIYEVMGRKCVNVKSAQSPAKHIMYFHGGAYSAQPTKPHWSLVDYMLTNAPLEVTFVNYPLAPEHKCPQTIEMAKAAYKAAFTGSTQEIILMGDSAGGGLAMAMAQVIERENILPKPDKIVLLSPWLDISMGDKLPEALEESDPVLDKDTLKEAGVNYAGDTDTKDFRCSPIYGKFTGEWQIAVFTGTYDILNYQANKLKDMINDSEKLSFYEYEEMLHVWMLFPIPEARDAKEQIMEFIAK